MDENIGYSYTVCCGVATSWTLLTDLRPGVASRQSIPQDWSAPTWLLGSSKSFSNFSRITWGYRCSVTISSHTEKTSTCNESFRKETPIVARKYAARTYGAVASREIVEKDEMAKNDINATSISDVKDTLQLRPLLSVAIPSLWTERSSP